MYIYFLLLYNIIIVNKERLVAIMKLKVGDVVEFKKYEDMTDNERMTLSKDSFSSFGTVIKVFDVLNFFFIAEEPYSYPIGSVARIINDINNCNLDVIRKGDEVLIKTTVEEVFNSFVKINSSVDKTDITKILKRKEPERFIVKEGCYNMYIGTSRELVSDKSKAKIFGLRAAAKAWATDMRLSEWKVIPYDD